MAAKVLLVLLEDIDDADLHTFKSYLETGVDGYEFSRTLLKDAKSKEDVVSCITARCGLQQAARLVEKVLMKMAKDHRATKYESKLGYESTAAGKFMRIHKSEIIQRVKSVELIANDLIPLIGFEIISKILQYGTSRDKMIELYSCLNGATHMKRFYLSLVIHEPHLVEELTCDALLLEHLEDLSENDFKAFAWNLSHGVPDFDTIPHDLLKLKMSRKDLVTIMINFYERHKAGIVMEQILRKIKQDVHPQSAGTKDKSMSLPTCCFCAYLKDLDTCWKQVCPSVCSEGRELLPDETGKEEDCKYSCTPAGSYECTVTGLRWVCDGDVTLKYNLTDWEPYEEELKRMGYEPCGPLFDITITSGVLKEVHLPHFVCLGSGAHIKDAVQALDVQDSGMILEACELTRFHAKLYNPTFSPKGLLVKTGFSVKTHCAVLIYQMLRAHLTLHVYLVPWDSRMLKSIEKMEKDALRIQQSNTECSLQMKYLYKLEIEPKNEDNPPLIQPETLKLRYTTISPNYFEVYIRNAIHDFELHLKNDENECVWKRKIQAVAYNQGLVSFAVWFYNKHMSKLIQRVSLVDPIADDLKSLIGNERYSIIINSQTSQEKMRKLFSFLSGEQQMLSLFQSLLKNEPLLVLDLVKQP